MSLKPEIQTPETAVTPPLETRETNAYDPERILAMLQKKAENAVNEQDKKNIKSLMDKLSASLASKSREASDGTRDTISSFRAQLSADHKVILADAEAAIVSGTEKTKEFVGKDGKAVVEKAKDIGGKAVEAIKSGNPDEVKKLAQGMKESVNAAGQKVMEFTGAAAMEKLLEPIKDGFNLMGIIEIIKNFFKFIFSGGKITEIVDAATGDAAKKGNDALKTATDVAQTAESAKDDVMRTFTDAQSAYQELKNIASSGKSDGYNAALHKFKDSLANLRKIEGKLSPEQREWLNKNKVMNLWNSDILNSPEERDKWIETQVGPVCKKIADEFYAGGNLSPEQVEMVRKGLKEMHFGQDTINMIRARAANPNDSTAISSADASTLLTELLFGNTDMLWLMFRIVPLHRFVWSVTKKAASDGRDSYYYNLDLVFNKIKGVKPPTMEFKSDTLMSSMAKMKNDPVAQDMMLMQMYRVNGLFASIAGAAVSGLVASAYMLVDNSHGADGFRDFSNVHLKKFDSLASEMEKIESAFPKNGKFKPEMAQVIRSELAAIKNNWLMLSLAKEGNHDATKIIALLKKPMYSGLGLTEADILSNSKNVRGFLATKMSAEGANASAFSRLPGRMFGTAGGAGGDFLDHLQDAKRFQLSIMKSDIASKIQHFGDSFKILTLPRHADKTLLYFKDIDSATNTLRQFGAGAAPFFGEIIRSLPAVSLVIGGVSMATEDSRTATQAEKLKNFGTIAATTLIPIVWPIMLMTDKDTAPRISKSGEIENIGTGVAAAGMLTLDGLLLMNAFRTGKIADFVLQRPRDVLRTVRGLVRTPTAIAHATARIVNPKWFMAAEKTMAKAPGKIGKILAATAALGAAGYAYAKGPEDHMQKLIEQGYWNGETGDITEKTKQDFAKMNAEEKKGFADTLSHAIFDRHAELPSAKSHVDSQGIYTLVADTPEGAKAWGTALNQEHAFFTEELGKLGMFVDITEKSTYDRKKQEKDAANTVAGVPEKKAA